MPITRVREYPAYSLHVLRERILDFSQRRGTPSSKITRPLAAVYDTFIANPPLREMTIQHMSDGSISYG